MPRGTHSLMNGLNTFVWAVVSPFNNNCIRIRFSETIIRQTKDSVVIYLYLISCRDLYSKTWNRTGTHNHVIRTNKSISLNHLKLQYFFILNFTYSHWLIIILYKNWHWLLSDAYCL